MPVDSIEGFASAAGRHLKDSKLLMQAGRFDNACYLGGYVAECGLKALIALAGHPPKIHDLRDLAGASLDFAAALSSAVRRYPLDLSSQLADLQTRWKVELRYSQTGSMNAQDAETLIKNADEVYRATIGAMTLDGLLERLPHDTL